MRRSDLFLSVAGVVLGLGFLFPMLISVNEILAHLRASLDFIQSNAGSNPYLYSAVLAIIYVAATACSLPGVFVLTMISGVMFPLIWAVSLVAFSCTCGSTLALLLTRRFFQADVRKKWPQQIAWLDQQIAAHGTAYLLNARLFPLFPYNLINILCAVTSVSIAKFFVLTAIGMLPLHLVYANAGRELNAIEKWSDIATPQVALSLGLLACLPMLSIFMTFFTHRAAKSFTPRLGP